MKTVTVYRGWRKVFHTKRDELRCMLRVQTTADLKAAFPEYAEDPRGRLITRVLCDFTTDFYRSMAAAESEAEAEEAGIEKQIKQFESL